jgi:hypothetical protein
VIIVVAGTVHRKERGTYIGIIARMIFASSDRRDSPDANKGKGE